jgi:fluoroquinolone transport system permease protein
VSLTAWQALASADSRLLMRDPLLGWLMVLPLGLAVLLRVLIPMIEQALAQAGFALGPYHPLIASGYLMNAAGIVGMVVGFLILDERDARTLNALRVTPLSMRRYLGYRLAAPLIVGTAAVLIGYPVTRLTPLPLATLMPIAIVGSLSAPTVALVLATFAPNKVAAFALVKVLNVVNLIPLIAYFIPMPAQLIAGVMPTYWPMRAVWAAAAGDSWLPVLGAGFAMNAAALVVFAALFERRLMKRG